jgi:hypothetical protein
MNPRTPGLAAALSMLAVAVGALGAVSACGPGFQAIYESDARFEHCYALDENPNVLMQQKSDCWGDWLKRYTYGQTRDRVEYAATRYRAITRIHVAPTDEALMSAAPGEGSQGASISGPAPTSAFAPPPKTMQAADARGRPAPSALPPEPAASAALPKNPATNPLPSASAETPRAPAADCTEGCWTSWQRCREGCAEKGCGVCDKKYGKCVKGCF